MAYLSILLAFIIGYYIGNRHQLKHDSGQLKEFYDNLTVNKEIKIIHKKEPKSDIAENLTKLEEKDATE